MRFSFRKKCPRCQTKMQPELMICPNCQLNFKKFNEATNAEAKQAIKEGRKDDVLLRTGCPADVKRWALILMTIFFGLFGMHYYYVGRNKMGIFFTLAFFVGVANAVILNMVTKQLIGIFWEIFPAIVIFVWGSVLFIWIVDIAKVCLNKFKIPVSRN